MAGRRELNFGRLDEVPDEVDRLLPGHDRAGSWSLGQALHHLASALRLTVEGPSTPPPEPDRRAGVYKRLFFRTGRFPDGFGVPDPALVPPAGLDDREQARTLRAAIARFGGHEGPFPAHPVLGPMTRDEWAAFHRIHCAHHLGFFAPTAGGAAPTPNLGEEPACDSSRPRS